MLRALAGRDFDFGEYFSYDTSYIIIIIVIIYYSYSINTPKESEDELELEEPEVPVGPSIVFSSDEESGDETRFI